MLYVYMHSCGTHSNELHYITNELTSKFTVANISNIINNLCQLDFAIDKDMLAVVKSRRLQEQLC